MFRDRPILPVVSALLMLAGAAAAQTPPAGQPALPSADELFALGVKLHQDGDILGAIAAYEGTLTRDPARVDARSNLGAAYVRLGRYEDAIEQYRKALEAMPGEPVVRFNLGLALYKAGRPGEAATELRSVLERAPDNRNALLLLADCELQLGRDRQVVELLSPYETELANDRLFAYLMGTALIRENALERGQAVIDRLMRQDDTAEVHLLIGAAHLRRKEYNLAVPEFRRAVELKPDLPTLHSLFGRALLGTGDRVAAAAAFRRELRANPTDFDSNLYLGLLLKDDYQLDEALDYLGRAARMRPRDPGILYALGIVHLAAGRVEEAGRQLEAAVQQSPNFSQAHVLLARVYYRQKKRELGDRERAIVEKLRAQAQSEQPAVVEEVAQPEGTAADPPREERP